MCSRDYLIILKTIPHIFPFLYRISKFFLLNFFQRSTLHWLLWGGGGGGGGVLICVVWFLRSNHNKCLANKRVVHVQFQTMCLDIILIYTTLICNEITILLMKELDNAILYMYCWESENLEDKVAIIK